MSNKELPAAAATLDAGPEGCGQLLMSMYRNIQQLEPGQILEVLSFDLGAQADIPAWCHLSGHTLVATADRGGITHYFIRKGAVAQA